MEWMVHFTRVFMGKDMQERQYEKKNVENHKGLLRDLRCKLDYINLTHQK